MDVFFVFCCLGGGRVLVVAGWAGECCFFAVWAWTGVHSLTDVPAWAGWGLTTRKTKQQKKQHGFPSFLFASREVPKD